MGYVTRIVLAAACAAMTGAAAADTLPARKAGLWESKTSGAGPAGAALTVRQCIDANTDELAQAAVQPGATCSKREVRKVAAGYEFESVCKVSEMAVEAKGLVTGDFVTNVKLEMTTTMSGIPGMPSGISTKMVIDNRRLGECEAGQKPGDVVMPNGRNVRAPGSK